MNLRTASGGGMKYYGQKEIFLESPEKGEPYGLTFQVTDVRTPLLSVRRLVEKGNQVVLSSRENESFILNPETKVKIPVVKKGGSFVIEAHFMKKGQRSGFARQA